MKAKIYLTAFFLTLCVGNFWAQEETVRFETIEQVTSLKPANEIPHTFLSEADQKNNQDRMINYYKSLILERWEEKELVKVWRELLWRYENATIINKKD
jgi:hypothetical protein